MADSIYRRPDYQQEAPGNKDPVQMAEKPDVYCSFSGISDRRTNLV